MADEPSLTELHELLNAWGEAHGKEGFADAVALKIGCQWKDAPDVSEYDARGRRWTLWLRESDMLIVRYVAIAALTTAFWEEAGKMGFRTMPDCTGHERLIGSPEGCLIIGNRWGSIAHPPDEAFLSFPNDRAAMFGLLRSAGKAGKKEPCHWNHIEANTASGTGSALTTALMRDVTRGLLELRDRIAWLEGKEPMSEEQWAYARSVAGRPAYATALGDMHCVAIVLVREVRLLRAKLAAAELERDTWKEALRENGK